MKQWQVNATTPERQAPALVPFGSGDLLDQFLAILRQGGDEASLLDFLNFLNPKERARLVALLILERMVANGRLIVVRGERPFRIFAVGETGESSP